MASLCSVKFKRLHLHFPFRLSFCLSLCLYLFLNRLNLSAPARKLPYTTTTSIKKVHRRNSSSTAIDSAILHTGNQVEANLEEGKYPFVRALKTVENRSDSCGGRYIYVHDLPPKFNEDILKDCDLFIGPKMCPYLENNGLGHKLENAQGVFSDNGWYDTDQFTLEPMIYHRMKQYDCLTHDSSLAAAIFVPFYAGCDISRHFFGYSNKIRDELSYELANWLRNTPEWRIMGGKDHFLVAGRVTWEFRRLTNNESDWGDQLFLIPETKNMTALVIESSPWHSNDFAIPYPTFFHPSNDVQLNQWQERVRNLKREWLFSFAGAPRPKDPKSIRSKILDQCKNSKVCKMLECSIGNDKSCHSPEKVMQLFQKSHFCLQPQGDSPTRKSTFDAIIAGCIPVFFHPGSAYIQYTWHLPKNYSTYSVFITEDEIHKNNASIDETLRKISPEVIVEMREKVIELIPKIVYADSGSKLRTFKDAFDISVEAVTRRVTRLRMDIVNGRKHEKFHEELSWKYALFEDDEDQPELLEAHEWDPYFRF